MVDEKLKDYLLEKMLIDKAEIEYSGDIPIIPPIRPVMILKGSDYEMGFQYGQQRVEIFGPYNTAYFYRHFKNRLTDKDKQILKHYENQIEKQTPWIIDFMRGIVDGSSNKGISISYQEVLAYFVREIKERIYDEKNNDCSGLVVWGKATKDGSLLFSGSGDHEMHPFETILIFMPNTGNNFLLSTDTGAGYHPGMNNKGVVYAHHGSGPYDVNDNSFKNNKGIYQIPTSFKETYGIPANFATMNTLRFANNAEEALKMQLSYNCITKRAMGLWADIYGSAFDIESNDPPAFRKPGDNGEKDFLYATNTFMIKELMEYEFKDIENKPKYIPGIGFFGTGNSRSALNISGSDRAAFLWNMLHNYSGEIDLDFLKMMWRLPGNPPDYLTLEEADEAFLEKHGAGWNINVATQNNSVVVVGKPDNGDKGLYFVSNGTLCNAASPFAAGRHSYLVSPTHSFYQLQLASSPEEITVAAKIRGQYDLYEANLQFSKLSFWDIPYAPLRKILDKSIIEWRKGYEYLNLGSITKDNDSIFYYSKSLRGFTRSQALARQVLNVLVPPAEKPEDLGLKKWLGSWGNWMIKPKGGWSNY